jgi:thioredoxin reductase (NADPH)
MARPVILTIDDDAEVLQAIARDLRQQYGDRCRIVRADSGATALETLQQLKLRNETLAIFLADRRMPQMSGVDFLERAIEYFPDAKRVLLTAYADTDAAIQAINSARLDYYLLKPWDPPEERLYPVLDDLLDDWFASFRPPFEGIRVVGNRWSSDSHQVKDFLARNQIPYEWLDIEQSKEGQELVEYVGCSRLELPIDRLTGAGVYYGAAQTEALACKDEEVYIVIWRKSSRQWAIGTLAIGFSPPAPSASPASPAFLHQ